MENQEAHQATGSAAEFNDMRNELRNLAHMMVVMMSRLENQALHPAAQDSRFPQDVTSNEVPNA